MSVTNEDKRLDAIRAEVASTQDRYRANADAVNANSNLSAEGKQAEIAQWRDLTKAKLDDLRRQEHQIVEEAITAREKLIDSKIGTSASDLIAFRDAQDRAERLDNDNEAQRVLERALRNDDTSLAGAVFRQALEKGWRTTIATLTTAKPELGDAVNDLTILSKFRSNTMRRAMAYTF